MLSIIIATDESERVLVPTLAALVPGAIAGLVTEVIIVDAQSRDATAEVADIAGCRFMALEAPTGTRLRQAAQTSRAPWLLFLRAGVVPDPGWVIAVEGFIEDSTRDDYADRRAAAFRPVLAGGQGGNIGRNALSDLRMLLWSFVGGAPNPDQGLLISRRFYDRIGGHPDGDNAEAAMIRRIGGRATEILSAGAVSRSQPSP
jgi:glycosyltransferase involved in cell wall biosynthesis